MRIWVLPEIERRRVAGEWTDADRLAAVQVLFTGAKSSVRLNQQVRGLLLVKPSGEIDHRKLSIGDALKIENVNSIENFELLIPDRNHGHITLLGFDGRIYLYFDAKQNRAEAMDLLTKAEEFLQAARDSKGRNHAAPCAENLFGAAELAAKAHLVSLIIDPTVKSHSVIFSQINLERHRGNTDGAFVDLFVKLSDLRQAARYSGCSVEMASHDDLGIVERQIKQVRTRYTRW